MYSEDILGIAGLFGVVLYLGSYAALQTGFLRGSSYSYAAVNGLAAALVLTSLMRDFNLSSVIIQISWIAISIFGIARLYFIRNWVSFHGEERDMLARKLPNLANDQARRLLASGEWIDLPSGSMLTQEGKKNGFLYYIASGNAEIQRNGEVVASLAAGDYVGEITCFNGSPATGSAIMTSSGRAFRVPVEILKSAAPLDSTLRVAIDQSIADDLREKLARSKPEAFLSRYRDMPSKASGS